LAPHFDDHDQRTVVLVWSGCRAARMEGPNDEARNGHRLFGRGLAGVLWAGEVLESTLITELERQNSMHPDHNAGSWDGLHHYVVLLKETTVEVVAERCEIARTDASPAEAPTR
jgi:hypothetical protein